MNTDICPSAGYTIQSAGVIEGIGTEVVGDCVATSAGSAGYKGGMTTEVFGDRDGSGEGVHYLGYGCGDG